MFNTLYFLYHNNYYDRIISIDWSLGLYLENVIQAVEGFNFNPNDGVNTEIIVNMPDSETPNYLIVCDENNNINSKWFVIDSNRIRGGQYKYTLHRDVISDYWNIIKQSPCLIEKCNLNTNNPLIFNNEDMTFNQIKTSETPLKDKSNCAWLVAYLSKNASGDQLKGSIKINSQGYLDILSYNEWSSVKKYSNLVSDQEVYFGTKKSLVYKIYHQNKIGGLDGRIDFDYNDATGWVDFSPDKTNSSSLELDNSIYFAEGITAGLTKNINTLNSLVDAYLTDGHTETEVKEFFDFNGRLVQDDDGKIYLVEVEVAGVSQPSTYSITAGSLYNALATTINDCKTSQKYMAGTSQEYVVDTYSFSKRTPNASSFKVEARFNTYKLKLILQNQYITSYDISGNTNRLSTTDAEYDIIAVPYGTVSVKNKSGTELVTTSAELGMSFITSLYRDETSSVAYDIQLVPYCPVPNLITDANEITINNAAEYTLIQQGADSDSPKNKGIIFHVPRCTFTSYIWGEGDTFIPKATSNIKRKINNECDKWRITSPNFSNYFDFSAEKNNGVFAYRVDCTYKPYSPYIHVAPLFDGLYGEDFNDPRGLVCGGDFSLSQVSDAWQNYQLQNKNYQQTFDRQIQNMEITNKYQKITDIASAVSGTVQGATAGAMLGGGWGAAIGGVVSGTTGTADVLINEKLRNEALDYTRDLFGYNLGNIQALPLTLTKVSAFNANNKIFPVLEYYTCTDREKEALANKLAYNGMTTMVISTIEENMGNNWEYTINNKTITSKNYIKAKPIRLQIYEDFHIANTIAKELDMGFYIDQEE